MILSHRIALDPTDEQRQAFIKAVGVARFTWNWALAEWKKEYEAGSKPNGNKLKRELSLSEREFVCENCDQVIDRDLNAAFNLKKKAAGLAVTARGEDVRPKALPDADLCEARTGGAMSFATRALDSR